MPKKKASKQTQNTKIDHNIDEISETIKELNKYLFSKHSQNYSIKSLASAITFDELASLCKSACLFNSDNLIESLVYFVRENRLDSINNSLVKQDAKEYFNNSLLKKDVDYSYDNRTKFCQEAHMYLKATDYITKRALSLKKEEFFQNTKLSLSDLHILILEKLNTIDLDQKMKTEDYFYFLISVINFHHKDLFDLDKLCTFEYLMLLEKLLQVVQKFEKHHSNLFTFVILTELSSIGEHLSKREDVERENIEHNFLLQLKAMLLFNKYHDVDLFCSFVIHDFLDLYLYAMPPMLLFITQNYQNKIDEFKTISSIKQNDASEEVSKKDQDQKKIDNELMQIILNIHETYYNHFNLPKELYSYMLVNNLFTKYNSILQNLSKKISSKTIRTKLSQYFLKHQEDLSEQLQELDKYKEYYDKQSKENYKDKLDNLINLGELSAHSTNLELKSLIIQYDYILQDLAKTKYTDNVDLVTESLKAEQKKYFLEFFQNIKDYVYKNSILLTVFNIDLFVYNLQEYFDNMQENDFMHIESALNKVPSNPISLEKQLQDIKPYIEWQQDNKSNEQQETSSKKKKKKKKKKKPGQPDTIESTLTNDIVAKDTKDPIDDKAEKKLEQQEISSKNKTKHHDNTRSKLTNEIVAKDTIDPINDKEKKPEQPDNTRSKLTNEIVAKDTKDPIDDEAEKPDTIESKLMEAVPAKNDIDKLGKQNIKKEGYKKKEKKNNRNPEGKLIQDFLSEEVTKTTNQPQRNNNIIPVNSNDHNIKGDLRLDNSNEKLLPIPSNSGNIPPGLAKLNESQRIENKEEIQLALNDNSTNKLNESQRIENKEEIQQALNDNSTNNIQNIKEFPSLSLASQYKETKKVQNKPPKDRQTPTGGNNKQQIQKQSSAVGDNKQQTKKQSSAVGDNKQQIQKQTTAVGNNQTHPPVKNQPSAPQQQREQKWPVAKEINPKASVNNKQDIILKEISEQFTFEEILLLSNAIYLFNNEDIRLANIVSDYSNSAFKKLSSYESDIRIIIGNKTRTQNQLDEYITKRAEILQKHNIKDASMPASHIYDIILYKLSNTDITLEELSNLIKFHPKGSFDLDKFSTSQYIMVLEKSLELLEQHAPEQSFNSKFIALNELLNIGNHLSQKNDIKTSDELFLQRKVLFLFKKYMTADLYQSFDQDKLDNILKYSQIELIPSTIDILHGANYNSQCMDPEYIKQQEKNKELQNKDINDCFQEYRDYFYRQNNSTVSNQEHNLIQIYQSILNNLVAKINDTKLDNTTRNKLCLNIKELNLVDAESNISRSVIPKTNIRKDQLNKKVIPTTQTSYAERPNYYQHNL